MEEENKPKSLSWLNASISIVGFFAPVGYLMGAGFYQGYLGVYVVSPSAFQLTVQETYVYTTMLFLVYSELP